MYSGKQPSEVIQFLTERLARYPTRIEVPTEINSGTRPLHRSEFVEDFVLWLYDLDDLG